jgi:hypothetical protein
MKLKTPHIKLGISIAEGIEILQSIATQIEKYEEDAEDFYKIIGEDFGCGFWAKDGVIHSSWYDDQLGRNSEAGINEKLMLYLSRYGAIDDWEQGINNGWIQFFNNEKAKIGMAYGLHKDVLRFNYFK